MVDEDKRLAVRRGAEHVRVKGATEELGEIVPSPVETEDQSVQVRVGREAEEGDERR
jgi:hypothetical protein